MGCLGLSRTDCGEYGVVEKKYIGGILGKVA